MTKILLNKQKKKRKLLWILATRELCYINGTASRKAKDDTTGGGKIYWKDSVLLSEEKNNIILTLLEDNSFPCREEKGKKSFW